MLSVYPSSCFLIYVRIPSLQLRIFQNHVIVMDIHHNILILELLKLYMSVYSISGNLKYPIDINSIPIYSFYWQDSFGMQFPPGLFHEDLRDQIQLCT